MNATSSMERMRALWLGQWRPGQSGRAQSPSRRNVESKQTPCATSRFAAAACRAASGLPRQHSGRRSYLGSTLIGIAALGALLQTSRLKSARKSVSR
jgi:hypothetical protein